MHTIPRGTLYEGSVSAVGRMLEGRSDAYVPVLAGDTKHPSLDMKHPSLDWPATSLLLRRLRRLPAASMPLETCIPALAGDILVAPTLRVRRMTFAPRRRLV